MQSSDDSVLQLVPAQHFMLAGPAATQGTAAVAPMQRFAGFVAAPNTAEHTASVALQSLSALCMQLVHSLPEALQAIRAEMRGEVKQELQGYRDVMRQLKDNMQSCIKTEVDKQLNLRLQEIEHTLEFAVADIRDLVTDLTQQKEFMTAVSERSVECLRVIKLLQEQESAHARKLAKLKHDFDECRDNLNTQQSAMAVRLNNLERECRSECSANYLDLKSVRNDVRKLQDAIARISPGPPAATPSKRNVQAADLHSSNPTKKSKTADNLQDSENQDQVQHTLLDILKQTLVELGRGALDQLQKAFTPKECLQKINARRAHPLSLLDFKRILFSLDTQAKLDAWCVEHKVRAFVAVWLWRQLRRCAQVPTMHLGALLLKKKSHLSKHVVSFGVPPGNRRRL